MKKICSFLLIIVFMVLLCSCSFNKDTATQTKQQTNTTASQTQSETSDKNNVTQNKATEKPDIDVTEEDKTDDNIALLCSNSWNCIESTNDSELLDQKRTYTFDFYYDGTVDSIYGIYCSDVVYFGAGTYTVKNDILTIEIDYVYRPVGEEEKFAYSVYCEYNVYEAQQGVVLTQLSNVGISRETQEGHKLALRVKNEWGK